MVVVRHFRSDISGHGVAVSTILIRSVSPVLGVVKGEVKTMVVVFLLIDLNEA